MPTLVLLRHGQSVWNLEDRFTGWWDIPLSPAGVEEARAAGAALRDEGIEVDRAHVSVLTRAIMTLNLALEEAGRLWVPTARHWRLNERHYGGLTGLNKAETRERHGEQQFFAWRRSFATPPPVMERDHPYAVWDDPRYAELSDDVIPATECLADVIERMLPYWYDAIAPDLKAGHTVLVAAHGNSLRALIKHLDDIDDEDITKVEIPTGVPIAYELDDHLRPKDHRNLR